MQQNAATVTTPQALRVVLAGGRVRRCDWPFGAYLFAMRVETTLASLCRRAGFSVPETAHYEHHLLTIQPTVYRVEEGACSPWVPTQADLFARDWVEVDA